MDSTQTTILIGFATTITAFFFGKSGILQKIVDFILGQKRDEKLNEAKELEKKDKQIEELTKIVDELKLSVSTLEKDLIQTSTYVRTLLAYLETLMPEGANPFIKEMAKEIRKEH